MPLGEIFLPWKILSNKCNVTFQKKPWCEAGKRRVNFILSQRHYGELVLCIYVVPYIYVWCQISVYTF